MAKAAVRSLGPHQKKIYDIFQRMTAKHSAWKVWQDFIQISALEISIAVDCRSREKRLQQLTQVTAAYDMDERKILAQAFAEAVDAMEEKPDQDFLGNMFMALELGNHWAGQFFTPYNVCEMLARVTFADEETKDRIEKENWIAVNDPACGAGATLLAFRNICKENGIGSDKVLFTAQDLDMTAALMCYIQLSLYDCAGYVAISDTLSSPVLSLGKTSLRPTFGDNAKDADCIWFTPAYFRDAWAFCRWLEICKKGDKK